jgi:hypothetical protein
MTTHQAKHTRILPFPFAESLVNAHLDAIHIQSRGRDQDLIMDYQEMHLTAPPILAWNDGGPCETLHGFYTPRRLHFYGIYAVDCRGQFANVDEVPPDHSLRSLQGMMQWRSPNGAICHLLLDSSEQDDVLLFSARRCTAEVRSGPAQPAACARQWSPPPLLPARLVPNPPRLHQRYGGDPVTIHIGRRVYHQRLFVGGLEIQGEQRPQVDAVLNLSEFANPWTKNGPPHATDRWAQKGEGKHGMSIEEITAEAQWVTERLRTGQRVLVHCTAGFNRSITICCAALILLEGLSAPAALERVRQRRPWARPDAYHCIALQWIAKNMHDLQ